MSTELSMLAASAVLTVVLAFPPVLALILSKGLPFAMGNRDEAYVLLAGYPDSRIERQVASSARRAI